MVPENSPRAKFVSAAETATAQGWHAMAAEVRKGLAPTAKVSAGHRKLMRPLAMQAWLLAVVPVHVDPATMPEHPVPLSCATMRPNSEAGAAQACNDVKVVEVTVTVLELVVLETVVTLEVVVVPVMVVEELVVADVVVAVRVVAVVDVTVVE